MASISTNNVVGKKKKSFRSKYKANKYVDYTYKKNPVSYGPMCVWLVHLISLTLATVTVLIAWKN